MKSWPAAFPLRRVLKWALIGLGFMGLNLPLLYALVDLLRLPLPVATLLAVAVGTLLRFLANDRLVFEETRPNWSRLRSYYLANSLGFGLWYAVANLLPHLGLHYLISAVCATACSVGLSLTTNFLWIWRTRPPAAGDVRKT
jgi:putative flippase GtrA